MTAPDDDYLWDRSGTPDPALARLEQLLAPLAHDRPLRRPRRRTPWIAAAAGGLVAVAAAVVLLWPRSDGSEPGDNYACSDRATGFRFDGQGRVACGGATVRSGVLPVGGTLDTGAHRAELAIANIGRAELGAQTRVRLERMSAQRHELFLERGRMHARVSAPPRIFAVATPGAHVTDLGCEYTLDIDDAGRGLLLVQSGKVELESGTGAVVVVPAGTHARMLAGRRAGLPIANDASPEVRLAVALYDHGLPEGLPRLLAAATPLDAITVASLVSLVPAAQQRAVLERLVALAPPPRDLSLDQLLAIPALYDLWREQIVLAQMVRAYDGT